MVEHLLTDYFFARDEPVAFVLERFLDDTVATDRAGCDAIFVHYALYVGLVFRLLVLLVEWWLVVWRVWCARGSWHPRPILHTILAMHLIRMNNCIRLNTRHLNALIKMPGNLRGDVIRMRLLLLLMVVISWSSTVALWIDVKSWRLIVWIVLLFRVRILMVEASSSSVSMIGSWLVRGTVLMIPCSHCSWLVEAF